MNNETHFAHAVCTYRNNDSSVFSRTTLVLKSKMNHTQTYQAVDIFNIPWEELWNIANVAFDTMDPNIKSNLESTIEQWLENRDITKNLLKYLGEAWEINDPSKLLIDKRKMWPIFVRKLKDEKFHDLMYDTSPIKQETVNNSTNNLMSKAIDNSQYLHTIRVLFRIQTEQLKILHRYNSQKNNIYFIDFKHGNKKSQYEGFRSNLELLSKEESKKDKENLIHARMAPRDYSKNEDIVYLRRLSDLLSALTYLKSLDKANFWAISGIPSVRATMTGNQEESDFDRSYFVAVREFEPGISGRLSSNNEFNDELYRELKKTNNPRKIKILDEIKELKNELLDQIRFTELKYKDDSISFHKHKKFVEMTNKMNSYQMDNFNRNELEMEAKEALERIAS